MIFKPKLDYREGESYIASRDGKKLLANNIEDISELENYNADVFFIDEFQFLQGNVKTIEKMEQEEFVKNIRELIEEQE